MKSIQIKDLYNYNGRVLFLTNTNREICGYVRCISSSISSPSLSGNGSNHMIGFRYVSESENDIYVNDLTLERTLSSAFIKEIFIL